MSMGSLVPKDNTIAWRGLMVQKAMNQLLFEVSWPILDLLILDLPPGTGDVQLTIVQSVELSGEYMTAVCRPRALLTLSRRCYCLHPTRPGNSRRSERGRSLSESQCTNLWHGTKHEYLRLHELRPPP